MSSAEVSDYLQEIDALKVALDWALRHMKEGTFSRFFYSGVSLKEMEEMVAAEAILAGNYSGKEVEVLRGCQ